MSEVELSYLQRLWSPVSPTPDSAVSHPFSRPSTCPSTLFISRLQKIAVTLLKLPPFKVAITCCLLMSAPTVLWGTSFPTILKGSLLVTLPKLLNPVDKY